MPRRWTKLQKQIYNLIAEDLPLQVHLTEITDALDDGSLNLLGNFRVVLGKEVIWHFLKDFVTFKTVWPDGGRLYSYSATDINRLIREYIDTPPAALLKTRFARDYCGIADVLKAADRRLGLKRLANHFKNSESKAVRKILDFRLSSTHRVQKRGLDSA